MECYYNGRHRRMMGYLEVGPDGFLRYRRYEGEYVYAVADCATKMEAIPW